MSTLYRRKKSPYVVYSSNYRGKRLRMSTGMRQMTLARQVQAKWDMMLFQGDLSFLNDSNLPTNDIDAFMDEYLRLRARISENTKNTAHAVTKRFKSYLQTIGVISISDITTKVLDGYIDFLDCAPKTKHNHMMELKVMLGKAIGDGLLGTNPVVNVTLPKIIKEDRHRLLEHEDLVIIFNSAGSWKLYFEFLYRTGLRAGDVAMLTHGNIDHRKSTIVSLVRKSRRIHEVPLAKVLLDEIGSGRKDEPLFPTLFAETGRKLIDNLAKPRQFMQALLKAEGRPKATLHSFRTTFNNTLRDLGLSMEDRQILLAHSSSETTKIYTHPNLELARKWVDRLPVYS